MTDITLRGTKGAPLTHQELDDNFANLKETADSAYDASVAIGGKANASALGTDAAATSMGTSPGDILSDNGTAKDWFGELEAALAAILSGAITFNLPDEADGDTIPSPGSGRLYLSGGVLKVA